jgi:hypothetical protein
VAHINPARVYVHDGTGRRMGVLTTATSVNRSYTIHEPGFARVDIAVDDPMLSNLDPREARFIVIESDIYPYPWVGLLLRPIWSRALGKVVLQAKSLDAILTKRYVSGTFFGGAGTIFQKIFDAIDNPTGIDLGQVALGPPLAVTFNDRSVHQAFTEVAQASGYEWWVDSRINETEIVSFVNFRPSKGQDRCRDAALVDGANAEWTDADIDAEALVFSLTIVGGNSIAGSAYADRPKTRRQGASGIRGELTVTPGQIHGHGIERFDTVSSPLVRADRVKVSEALRAADDVDAAVVSLLERPGRPERSQKWRLIAQDQSTDWGDFEVGNVVRAIAPDMYFNGFDGNVRILAAQPFEATGEMDIVVQVVGPCSGD